MRARMALVWIVLGGGASASAGEEAVRSKKEAWLVEKAARKAVHARSTPPAAIAPVSVMNLWTHEVLPVPPGERPDGRVIDSFLSCHWTHQSTAMDRRPFDLALAAAERFHASLVEIVSAYRAPKFNLMLRKKGHAVARESQHPLGHALDFRLPGLPTKKLLAFVRSLHLGGVGFYPQSAFVHADVGPVRYWKGR